MSFKSIGELCRDVIAEAELAARASKSRKNLGSAPLWEEGESEAPLPSLEVAPANRVKGRGAKPRQVQNRGWARSREGDDARTVNAPALVLIWSNRGEPTHAAHEGVFPARRVGSPVWLIAVDGRRVHAASR
jgi:hypothetical protein